jgi:hypothetical protein
MQMDLAGLREERVMRVYRDDVGGRDERVLIRFDAPADLRNVGLLYLEQAGRPNDYFLYQPAMKRIRRLPQSVAEGRAGITSGSSASAWRNRADGDPRRDGEGSRTRGLESRGRRFRTRASRRGAPGSTRRTSSARTEHLRDRRVVLAETLEVVEIQGVATPKRMRFHKTIEKREVLLTVDSVDYQAPIAEEHFSALALLRAQTPK